MADTECTVKNIKLLFSKRALEYETTPHFKSKDRPRPVFKFNGKRQCIVKKCGQAWRDDKKSLFSLLSAIHNASTNGESYLSLRHQNKGENFEVIGGSMSVYNLHTSRPWNFLLSWSMERITFWS